MKRQPTASSLCVPFRTQKLAFLTDTHAGLSDFVINCSRRCRRRAQLERDVLVFWGKGESPPHMCEGN